MKREAQTSFLASNIMSKCVLLEDTLIDFTNVGCTMLWLKKKYDGEERKEKCKKKNEMFLLSWTHLCGGVEYLKTCQTSFHLMWCKI